MSSFIAAGTTEVSTDFTLTDGQSATIALMPPVGGEVPSDAVIEIRYKTANGYVVYDTLRAERGQLVGSIHSPGPWNVRKLPGPNFGVDKT